MARDGSLFSTPMHMQPMLKLLSCNPACTQAASCRLCTGSLDLRLSQQAHDQARIAIQVVFMPEPCNCLSLATWRSVHQPAA